MVPLSTELRRARTAFLCGCVALVVGAALAVYAAVDKAVTLPTAALPFALVLMVVGLLAALLGKRAELQEKRAKGDREWRAAVSPLLRQWPLPKARALSDVDCGATRTRHTDGANPYVPRTADRPLRYALGSRRFVLLRGDSKAGKSRTLAEALRHTHPDADVVLPRDTRAVAELSRLEPPLPLEDAVVLLDDLTTTDLDLLTTAVLDFWATRAVLVGTITTSRHEAALRTGSDVGAAARSALARATVVDLPFELTAAELAAARDDYPDEPGFTTTSGIGEVLVGGEELVRKLRAGRRDSPAGQAIARAAVDARRVGLGRPVTEPELVRLFPKYLERITVGVDPTEDVFAAGLSWATTPIASQVALLRRVTGGFEPLDYVVTAEAGTPLPEDTAPDLLAITSPADAYGLAAAAYTAGRRDVARDGFRKAMEHPESLPAAAFSLAITMADQDDAAGAERAYQQAVATEDPLYAYLAGVNLGFLHLKRGAVDEAEAAFAAAASTRPLERGPRARVGLAEVHLVRNQHAEAAALFRQVAALDDPATTPMALRGLAKTLEAQGDRAAAQEVYRTAATSANPELVAWAKAALES
ncbi:hypothetical protein [Umezawaea sp.]|uniref:tetratricopeptide repeat protein n=1 Tax=Umezawaea sp. TaxID=1955258 RepID=UPI002ED1C6C9